MKFDKIKEILKGKNINFKDKKVQAISGVVAGVLVLTVAGTIILNNKNVENKNIVVEKDDKKVSNKENNDIKEQLEELKSIDTSNMSDEEKKELENKIEDTEKKVADNDNDGTSEKVTSNTSTSKANSTSTTRANSGTSTNTNKGNNSNSKPSSGSPSNSNSSNNTGSSSSGSTGGNTTNKEEAHTHSLVPITSVVHHEEQGHYEKILVSEAWTEEVPIYEEQAREICNGCGADITADPYTHNENHMLNGEAGGWTTEWKKVQVGTNKINHDAVYEDKWVVDKAAWDETVTTGYKCSSCGATK